MTEIVSHRGGALLWPENSLTACENTIRLGAEQLQLDIHPSRDGRIVVIHDGTLDRTTDASGRIIDHDWSDLRDIVLKDSGGQRIPSLDDAIAAIRSSDIVLRIEIKRDKNGRPYPDLPASLAASLHGGGMAERTILTSFSVDAVVAAAALVPEARTGLLANAATLQTEGLAALIASVKARGMESLGLKWDALTAAAVVEMHAAGLKVGAFACNDQHSIGQALLLEVDELMTDRPDLALDLRRHRSKAGAA